MRLQHLVEVAYDESDAAPDWLSRPGQFVDYIRDEFKKHDPSSATVRVMTVHKAKGLEFDVVIVPVKYNRNGWTGSTPTVIVDRETSVSPIRLVTRYVNQKERKLLPKAFQEMCDETSRRKIREEMCVLYVALTRARYATHVILHSGVKPDKGYTSSVVMATLADGSAEDGEAIYENGNPDWHQSVELEQTSDPHRLAEFYLPAEATAKRDAVTDEARSRRGVSLGSGTDLQRNQINIREIMTDSEAARKKERGILVHGCFERVTWLDQSPLDRSLLLAHLKRIRQQQRLTTTETELEKIIDQFLGWIERPHLRQLLSRPTDQYRYVVKNEWPFAIELDETQIVRGTIDRLVLVYSDNQLSAAEVIDFKTGVFPDSKTLQQRIKSYQPQLSRLSPSHQPDDRFGNGKNYSQTGVC